MSDHLIAEANRHAKAIPKMTLPTTKPNGRDLSWYVAECIDLKKQLEMECAAKREHMRIACAEINELKVKAGFYEQENAALRTVLKRWLKVADDCHQEQQEVGYSEYNITVGLVCDTRAILDAARKEAQP